MFVAPVPNLLEIARKLLMINDNKVKRILKVHIISVR